MPELTDTAWKAVEPVLTARKGRKGRKGRKASNRSRSTCPPARSA
ncbi:hypothetical protein AB0O67_30560 [Streptomyces sp. NPDC086077]